MSTWFIALLMSAGLVMIAKSISDARTPKLLSRVSVGNFSSASASVASIDWFSRSRRHSKNVNRQIMFELPEIVDLLAVALAAGESLYSALRLVVPRTSGVLAKELERVIAALDLGADIETELNELSQRVSGRQIAEFSNKLILALSRGTPLAAVMLDQSVAVRAELQQQLTVLAGKNETRMLIPLVFLILPITVLFAIYPSLQLLNLNYN
jgi:tight adherence protein C